MVPVGADVVVLEDPVGPVDAVALAASVAACSGSHRMWPFKTTSKPTRSNGPKSPSSPNPKTNACKTCEPRWDSVPEGIVRRAGRTLPLNRATPSPDRPPVASRRVDSLPGRGVVDSLPVKGVVDSLPVKGVVDSLRVKGAVDSLLVKGAAVGSLRVRELQGRGGLVGGATVRSRPRSKSSK